MYGWMGTILRVNLTNRKITREPLAEEIAHKYIGGRGFGSKFLYDELKPGIDPLGPDNKVIFAVGPACGTLLPANQRWTVSAKSPLSGFIGDANCGSPFGAAFKYAGYDMLIIEGKSDKPLYLLIDHDDVQLRDATHLWGKTTTEATRFIEKELTDPNVHMACIGPAGENLVRFASVMSENRAAARCGIGAVLGSKKLKAVVARGNRGVKVANLEALERVSREQYEAWRKGSVDELKVRQEVGYAIALFRRYNELGIIGTKNYREGPFEGYELVSEREIKKRYLGPRSCFTCPVACNHLFIVSEGLYAGTFGEDLFAPAMQYTARIGNTDVDFMFKLAALSDQYGIDEMNMGSVFGYVMECFEAGILTESDLGGLQMEWGNTRAIIELMEMVVNRKGIGDLLAEGVTSASEVIGKGSRQYVMEVKGLSIDSRDPRGSKGWGLGYAVSSRGADHCRHLMPEVSLKGASGPEWMKEVFQGYSDLAPFSEKRKGEIIKWYEDVCAFQHCLEICLFELKSSVPWPKVLAEMYNAVTGLDISANEVNIVGERLTNLERVFNIREGLTRKDDTLPDRFLKEPAKSGPREGHVVKLDAMIDEYYELRGWEKETGFPVRAKLEELDLTDVADELEGMGRLAHKGNLT